LPISFTREDYGIYYFGSKRIFVKLEQNDTILVRVGGGYMQLSDFIEQYSSIELEKMDRKPSTPKLHSNYLVPEA